MWTASDYTPGDEVETIRQTVYEMEHGSPGIWMWTNVPHLERFGQEHFQKYPGLEQIVEELKPLQATFQGSPTTEAKIEILNRIADRIDLYKRDLGIEILDL